MTIEGAQLKIRNLYIKHPAIQRFSEIATLLRTVLAV